MRNPFQALRIFGHVGRWLAFFRRFLPVAGAYWRSEGKWRIRAMTAALLLLTGLQIVVATSINLWIQSLFDALENRDISRVLTLVGVAAVIIASNIAVTIFHLSAKRWLQIGWREWLTHRLLGEWMKDAQHYKVSLFPGEHSNPDGRIAEDIRFATEMAIELGHSLLYALLILVSFATILWGLSGPPNVSLAGYTFPVPGHLVWIALAYAAIGTFVALRLGLPLIKAQNLRQTTEADFRFGLAHTRENSLLVALLRGEGNEERGLVALFRGAMRSWNLQTRALVSLFYFSSAWWVLSQVFPILVASPRYLAGAITLGILMQTAQAFQQMVGALSWPVDNVSRVAEWRASAERMLGLHDALDAVRKGHLPVRAGTLSVETGAEAKLVFDALALADTNGAPMMAPLSTEILPGQRVLITAEATVGFNLFKALGELWPWGQGRIVLPGNGPLFMAARRPYLPLGLLRDVVAYPEGAAHFDDAAIAGVLTRVGLGHRVGDLDRRAQWGENLSEDEQSRISFARLLLARPKWIVFQETFDALAPDTRAAMMQLLDRECPDTGFLIIDHAPDLDGFVTHRLRITPCASPRAMHG